MWGVFVFRAAYHSTFRLFNFPKKAVISNISEAGLSDGIVIRKPTFRLGILALYRAHVIATSLLIVDIRHGVKIRIVIFLSQKRRVRL